MNETKEVYKAIAAVQGEMAIEGIGKNKKNEMQGYKFRGIDDIYNALAPLLSKHGLCILPRVVNRSVTEQESRNGGKLFYTVVDVEFDLVSSKDSSAHTIRVCGEAMDSGDKATNKAMSAAYKYACLQTFCIPTEGDNDADAKTHEVKAKPKPEAAGPQKTPVQESLKLPPVAKKVLEAIKVIDYERISTFAMNDKGGHAGVIIGGVVLKALQPQQAKELEAAFNLDQRVKVQYMPTATGNEIIKFKVEEKAAQ